MSLNIALQEVTQMSTNTYNNTGIYKISNKLNPNLYVGSAVDLESHWKEYKGKLNHNRFHNKHLQRAWNKYGPDAFEYIHLEYTTLEQLDRVWSDKHKCMLIQPEQDWIDKYWDSGVLYNTCRIAGSTKGRKKSKEQKNKEILYWTTENRKKQSQKISGENNGMFRKHHTPEALEKCVKRGKEHPMYKKHHTEEAKEKNRQSHLGKKATPEAIEKMLKKKEKYLYILMDPLGKKYKTKNLKKFGRDYNLSFPLIINKPITRGPNKGWQLISKILLPIQH
jgi:group I intron endonuclease